MTEAEMRRRLHRGNRQDFEEIVRYYTPYVMTILQNQLGTEHTEADVEEVCMDVFLALWHNREKIHSDNLRGWLVRVARNKACDLMRKKGVRTVPLEDLLAVDDDRILDEMEQKEKSHLVRDALGKLGEPDREIFLRYYYYEQKIGEIAGEMGMNPETVKSRLKRGREALKKILEQEGFLHAD